MNITNGSKYNHAIIMPSKACFNTYEQYFTRFLEFTVNRKCIIILSLVKSNDEDETTRIIELCKSLKDTIEASYKLQCPDIDFVLSEKDTSFSTAVNVGINLLKEKYALTEFLTIAHDDLIVTKDWLKHIERACVSDYINTKNRQIQDELPLELEEVYNQKVKIGFAGPLSYGAIGNQQVANAEMLSGIGIDKYSAQYHRHNVGTYIVTESLDGFCLTLKKDFLEEVWDSSIGGLYDESLQGYERQVDDLIFRANEKNWIGVICADCYIGHTRLDKSLDKKYKDNLIADNIYLIRKYSEKTLKEQKIIACYRADLETINDIAQFKSSVARTAKNVDGISIVVPHNPSICLQSYDSALAQQLIPQDFQYLNDCLRVSASENEKEKIEELTTKWIKDSLDFCQTQYNQFIDNSPVNNEENIYINYNVDLLVEFWNKEQNPREETNLCHTNAYSLNADWILSLDSDEIIEDRISYELLHKWCRTPNLKTQTITTRILHHWESTQLLRTDRNFGSMVSNKLFRCIPVQQKLVDGTEEGVGFSHAPETGHLSVSVAGLRTRKLSHIRTGDRVAKYNNYMSQDELDPKLFGVDGFNHILDRQVSVRFYMPKNGIGLFMLSHKDDQLFDLHNWIDKTYMLCDKQVITWTEKWDIEDQIWINHSIEELPKKETWREVYNTGPSWEFAFICKIYSVDICHRLLCNNKGLSHCRNKGIEYLMENNPDSLMRWAIFFDPDEEPVDYLETFQEISKLAENEDTLGYFFNFKNILNDFDRKTGLPKSSPSESIRMFVLHPSMKMDGLVHEGFEKAILKLINTKERSTLRDSEIVIINRGLSLDGKQMGEKLKKYGELLLDHLIEDPKDAKAWISLGLQFINDGNVKNGTICLEEACKQSQKSGAFLPFKEASMNHLRIALFYLRQVPMRLSKNHKFYDKARSMILTLEKLNIEIPIINTEGYTITLDEDLSEKIEQIGLPSSKLLGLGELGITNVD